MARGNSKWTWLKNRLNLHIETEFPAFVNLSDAERLDSEHKPFKTLDRRAQSVELNRARSSAWTAKILHRASMAKYSVGQSNIQGHLFAFVI
jgi:hypothetical protein